MITDENITLGMHTAVGELLAACCDPQVKVSTLLLKAKIIANELDDQEFLTFVNAQLQGYEAENIEIVPTYRSGNFSVVYHNPYRGWQSVIFGSGRLTEMFCYRKLPHSVHELENNAESKDDSYIPLPIELQNELRKSDGSSDREQFYWFITRKTFSNVLSQIRIAIQDWCLGLKRLGIHGTTVIFSHHEKEQLNKEQTSMPHSTTVNNYGIIHNQPQHFTNTVEGDGSQIIIGDNNVVIVNDIESLKTAITSHGINAEDFAELLKIIDLYNKAKTDKATLFSKAKAWLFGVAKNTTTTLTVATLTHYITLFLSSVSS